MVYLSHNWGMGDSDCMPCYEPVDVHHRIRTNSTGHVDSVNNHRHVDDHVLLRRLDGSAPHQATTVPSSPSSNGHQRKIEQAGLALGIGRGFGPAEGLVQTAGGGSVVGGGAGGQAAGAVDDEHNRVLRKPLTPAASEDHHDSDYDEISIHPLSNQVS